ncbi:YeeE/YedE thiosulfate transporter family protein [Geminicoccaceae bacterium 1502E]|nr:YeeE/YedE thiosulfate transporter family protein [Geminicoccaceae bacterium 1502E]
MTALLLLVAVPLALAAGFSAQRGGICAVRAIEEVVTLGRWSRFLSFLECALWVLAILLVLHAAGIAELPAVAAWQPGIHTLAGGALFGIGAVINGACLLGSAVALAGGRVSYLALLPAVGLGGLAGSALGSPAAQVGAPGMLASGAHVAAPAAIAAALFSVWRLASVRRRCPSLRCVGDVLRGTRWPPGVAMAAIALVNTPLLLTVEAWPYGAVLADLARGGSGARLLTGVLLALALLGGAALAARTAGSFRYRSPEARQIARSLVGGALMGAGAALVPGGNTSLVLEGLPLLAPHALIAYPAMVAAMAAGVAVRHRLSGGTWRGRTAQAASLSPRMPATIRPMQARRRASAGSP